MTSKLEAFAAQIPDVGQRTKSELVSYFAYYLTVIEGQGDTTATKVDECFAKLRIPPYSNIRALLSAKSKRGKGQSFIRTKTGYHLTREAQTEVQQKLHSGPAKVETSILLRDLLPKISDPTERSFLQEAIDCYEIGARRAAILMTWLLSLSHLYQHVLKHKLSEFNAALVADKGVKLSAITNIDDFAEISKEVKLIELLRASKVISNDVRKILDTKLGIRNSAAHPANVSISEVKATDFIIDLIENVVLKYSA
ncbi:hypothetical protein [Dyella sp.]|jgi:hypothetical protein|uniref:hypothetical protein n=1 Tax=Dyella sp. TaxID=1869338 RepID=UPI002D78D130|nr:hypothetical protein [Dyella sp.]HET6432647.1 hypothetical protein [Dyella sp.]